MAEHANNLKSCAGEAAQTVETLRARFSLFSIVEERLNCVLSVIENVNPKMVQGLKSLQASQTKVFQEMFSFAKEQLSAAMPTVCGICGSSTSKGNSPSVPPIPGFGPAGSAAFAARCKTANSPRGSNSSASPHTANIDSPMRTGPSNRNGEEGSDVDDTVPANVRSGSQGPSPASERSRSSPTAHAVFSEIRGCNSYAIRHKKTRGFGVYSAEESTFSFRLSKDQLSIQHLLEIMQSVYDSKDEHNVRCKERGEHVQTMEQHFYFYLTRRYGNKSAVQEWASGIYRLIQRYSQKDCQVAVFGKVLQNRLSETFPQVLSTLRSKVHELLREQMEMRSRDRSQAEFDSLWQSFLEGNTPERCCVSISDVQYIVSELYNGDDSKEVTDRMLQLCSNNDFNFNQAIRPDHIRLRDVCQVLYKFQMNITEAFLADFITMFRKADTLYNSDKMGINGVLNQQQLDELIQCLSFIEELPEASIVLAEARDKVKTQVRSLQRATFSQCVDLFGVLINARWEAKRHAGFLY